MPYREIHLNSGAYSGRVAESSNSRPRFRMSEPLYLEAFQVKHVTFPNSFRLFQTAQTFKVTCTFNTGQIVGVYTIAAGDYTLGELAAAIETQFKAGTDFNAASHAGFTASVESDLRLKFTFGAGLDNPAGTATDGTEPYFTWETAELRRVFSRSEQSFTLPETPNPLSSPAVLAAFSHTTISPGTVIPNYFYLCSNLMSGTPWASQQRATGSWNSRTITCKVPIDFNNAGGFTSFTNEMSPAFMFPVSRKYDELEFWIEDEFGTVIDFMGQPISCTLGCQYGY